jgi:AcrR family transcriptional regulator
MARTRTEGEPPPPARRQPTPRRRELLAVAAQLFAERGYGGTSTDDLGAAAGISGPALYWHFPSKDALLAEMLTDVSERLLDGARSCVAGCADAEAALDALVEFQASFAVDNPALITVHRRELPHLGARDRQVVRRTQRRYLEEWVTVLGALHPERNEHELLAATHAIFGLLNSTPNIPSQDPAQLRELLVRLAHGAASSLAAAPVSGS